jgi:hypothetical protein
MRSTLMAIAVWLSAGGNAISMVSGVFLIDWKMTDDQINENIELAYTNTFDRDVCLDVGDWPNALGRVNQMSDMMYLVVGQRRFPIRDLNTGYCVGDCSVRVSPRMTIRATIPYAEFTLPDELRHEKKSLEYPITGDFCE